MGRTPHIIETCPVCKNQFTAPPVKKGSGSPQKQCPNGHWTAVHILIKARKPKHDPTIFSKARACGVAGQVEAMRLALAAMIGGYDRLLATTPASSRAVIEGAFGNSAKVARQIGEIA
jgi:hypothetical protein